MRIFFVLLAIVAFSIQPRVFAQDAEQVSPVEGRELTPALSLNGVEEVPFLVCARVFLSYFDAESMAPGVVVSTRSKIHPQHFSEDVVGLVQAFQAKRKELADHARKTSLGRKYELLPLQETDGEQWLVRSAELEMRETSELLAISEDTYLELLRRLDRDTRLQVNTYVREVACGDGISLHTNGSTWESSIFDRSAVFETQLEEELKK